MPRTGAEVDPAEAGDEGIRPYYGYDDAEKTDGTGDGNIGQSDPDGGPDEEAGNVR